MSTRTYRRASRERAPVTLGSINMRCVRTESGCLEWQGSKNSKGYGNILFEGKMRTLTRVVMHLAHDFDMEDRDLFILHHCDNPKCVRIAHLYIGSAQDNMNDMVKRKRVRKKAEFYAAKK